jgi:hypothetical protein
MGRPLLLLLLPRAVDSPFPDAAANSVMSSCPGAAAAAVAYDSNGSNGL